MKVSPARAAAFDALLRVERDAAFATDALDSRLEEAQAKREDAALATELVMGVLRWQRLLDFLIERYSERAVDTLDPEVLLALRLGLYQLRFLSRVPAAAAVNESVELVKRARKRSAAGFVNAALRRATRDPALRGPAESLLPGGLSASERLGIALSHPGWLVERWLARFGEESTRALLETNNSPPSLSAAVLDPAQTAGVMASLDAEGFEAAPGKWLSAAIELRRVPKGGAARAGAVRTGRMFFQDEASQMVPLLLDVQPGRRVLDLCAAPGGKTARLARQAGQPGVVAADLHLHRLRQMRAFLQKLGARNTYAVALNGTLPLPFGVRFERILVDAPCSGTGTLARNPEIRWRLRPEDLPALAEKQTALLSHALDQLAPGGRLVYSTCSLEPEENEEVVASALAAHRGVRRAAGESALARELRPTVDAHTLFDSQGCFRTLPWVHGTDGFFAAILEAR
ncbi:MAG TPA: 16S rRNA (cytosine(967)-C(5))-methyltransferase RsmB [Candidatus Acidoferrales bacterium]|nr:16S rRNA (cytosine(967)-C(5))-methyltransferase RsmB [Candidatus Acidoferrales bacterium]